MNVDRCARYTAHGLFSFIEAVLGKMPGWEDGILQVTFKHEYVQGKIGAGYVGSVVWQWQRIDRVHWRQSLLG